MFSGRSYSHAVNPPKPSANKGKRRPNKNTSPKNGAVPNPRFPFGKYNQDLSDPKLVDECIRVFRRTVKGS